jgi:thioredoxin-related protein
MKKLITIILIISSFFSIASTNAYKSFDDILKLDTGIEKYKFELPKIDTVSFRNTDSRQMYNDFVDTDNNFRSTIFSLYNNGTYDYYTMNGIVTEYTLFIHNTNKVFYYMKMKETSNYRELDSIILKHYEAVKLNYERVKYLLTPKKKTENIKVHCYNKDLNAIGYLED